MVYSPLGLKMFRATLALPSRTGVLAARTVAGSARETQRAQRKPKKFNNLGVLCDFA